MFDRSRLSPNDEMYEHIDDINRAIADVRSHLTDEIKIDLELSHLSVFVDAQRYLQAHVRRALMFLDGGLHALEGGYGLVAISCVRSVYESTACIYDFSERFFKIAETKDLLAMERFVHERSLAIKFEDFRPDSDYHNFKPQSIMTYLDKLGEEVPGARRTYEQLSEAAHPNAFGAILYFERVNNGIARYSNGNDELDIYGLLVVAGSLFSCIRRELLGFLSAYAKVMADLLQERVDDYHRRKAAGLTDD
jgi:hypothetical protein